MCCVMGWPPGHRLSRLGKVGRPVPPRAGTDPWPERGRDLDEEIPGRGVICSVLCRLENTVLNFFIILTFINFH